MNKKPIRLTRKTAEHILRRELGQKLSLQVDDMSLPAQRYHASTGNLHITIENDWYERNGLIRLRVADPSGQDIHMYIRPETLERDLLAEEKRRIVLERERLESWANLHGAAFCHKMIDQWTK